MGKTICVNSFVGINKILRIMRRRAKQLGREEVIKEAVETVSSLPESYQGKPAIRILSHFADELGIKIYDGDKPEPDRPIFITSITAKGKIMGKLLGVELKEDKIYCYNGEHLYEVE